MELLEPKTVEVTDGEGRKKSFTISKFPAVQGREIVTQWPVSAMPKVGDYKTNEAIMLKIMGYCEAIKEGVPIRLSTLDLVNNHVTDTEMLMKLEWEAMQYNISFLRSGGSSSFLETIAAKARPFATQMLTDLLERSFQTAKPPSTT